MSSPGPYLPPGLPQPRPDEIDEPFWSALREHRLVIQRCDDCLRWRFAPDVICASCHSFSYSWESVQPEGIVYSWERVWHSVHPALNDAVPYVVVLVAVPQAGDVRLVGNLLGPPEEALEIGAPLRGVFEDHDGYTLLQWERA